MKKLLLTVGVVFGIGFFGPSIVQADESNEIWTILQSGEITDELDNHIQQIIEEEELKNQMPENTTSSNFSTIAPRALIIDPWANWRLGTKIVREAGYPNTAMYMKHAEVINGKAPSTHTSNNNAWANSVIKDDGLLGTAYSKVRAWIRSGKKGSTSISGQYNFESGDKYYALHGVKYSYTFTRLSNGGVKTSGTVTDVYDFAWSNYNSIKTGFANNYAKLAQDMGLIKPYNIVIKATF